MKLSELKMMFPLQSVRMRLKDGRKELVFGGNPTFPKEGVFFTVDPAAIRDADGNPFEDDLPITKVQLGSIEVG